MIPVLRVINVTREQTVASSTRVARSLLSRLRGLLWGPPLAKGEGLYLVPCSSIHMIGMNFSIDAIFVDSQDKVVGLVRDIKPGRVSSYYWRAHGCLELPPGTIDATGTRIGDYLEFKEMAAG